MELDGRYRLVESLRKRYLRASKAQRGVLLSAFCDATGQPALRHERPAGTGPVPKAKPRGRLRAYDEHFTDALRLVAREEVNGRTRQLYDHPATPLNRVLVSSVPAPADGGRPSPVRPTKPAHDQAPYRPPDLDPTSATETRRQCLNSAAAEASLSESLLTERLYLSQSGSVLTDLGGEILRLV